MIEMTMERRCVDVVERCFQRAWTEGQALRILRHSVSHGAAVRAVTPEYIVTRTEKDGAFYTVVYTGDLATMQTLVRFASSCFPLIVTMAVVGN